MKYILIYLLLLFASCKSSRPQEVSPQDSRYTTLVLDSMSVNNPDSLKGSKVPRKSLKLIVFGGKKVKLKNATILVQQGENNVANSTHKAKDSQVVVAGDDATLNQIKKPKNAVVTAGDNSPASQTQFKKLNNWYLWLILGAVLPVGLYLFLKTK